LLQSGQFVVTAEIGTPRGSDHQSLLEKTKLLKDYCDAINIPDNPRRIPRMSGIACARFVLDAEAEPVLQIALKDRNRVAFKSDLYGAYALGVRNVLFVTGDLPGIGSDSQADLVSDIDSVQALQMAAHMMSGKNHTDEELEGVPAFFLGATFDPGIDQFAENVRRTRQKHESGAKFFQTQAIYEVDSFVEFMESIEDLDTYVLAGVVPLRSPEFAEFMNEHVSGVNIPDVIIQRLENAADRLDGEEREQATQAEGMMIATETISVLRRIKGVDGVHIMAVGWESCVPELVKSVGLYPRPS
jgi:methylenetetrahydrofolate reductase (NADPH)